MSDTKRSSHGCMWAVITVVLLLGAAMAFMGAGLAWLGRSIHMPSVAKPSSYGSDEFPELSETWASGQGQTKVVMIPIRGMIMLDDAEGMFASSSGSAQMALKSIHRATADQKVKALILDIDSGGGGITASDVILQALLDFKDSQPGRKVVSVFGDMAASGAYYIAVGSDTIVARPTSVTGSIGVLMQSINVKELGEKIGIRDVTIKSGKNKDILNPFTDLSDEQRAMLQGIVNSLHERFIGIVAEHRELSVEKVRELADGRVFLAQEAMELGLVDEVGYWKDGVAATAGLLDVPDVKVFRYEKEFSLSDIFASQSLVNPQAWLRLLPSTRFLYFWQP
jgi:protease IV